MWVPGIFCDIPAVTKAGDVGMRLPGALLTWEGQSAAVAKNHIQRSDTCSAERARGAPDGSLPPELCDGHTSTAAHSKAVILRVTSVWNQLWSWECWENNQNVFVC